MSVTPEEADPVTGLPKVVDVEAARKKGVKVMLMTWGLNHVFMAVGLGVAFLVYYFTGRDTYDKKLAAGSAAQLGLPCLAIVVFAYSVAWINIFPLVYKEAIMPPAGNIRANQFLYRNATDNDASSSAIVLYSDGKVGNYNRGNRSIGHFLESCLPILTTLPIGYYIYPFVTAIILIVYSLARVGY